MSQPEDLVSIDFGDEIYPYRKFIEMREEKGDLVAIGDGQWIALGYDVVKEILLDTDFQSMSPVENGVDRAVAGRNRLLQFFLRPIMRMILKRHKFLSMVKLWLVMNDPPTHTRLRKISQTAFTPASIRNLIPKIEKVTNDLLDQLEGKDKVDLMSEFALPLPIAMIAAIIGIPNEGADKFNSWSQDILKGFDQDPENYDVVKQAMQAQDEVKEFLTAIIREREQDPKDDVISLMLQARDTSDDDDLYMTDDEIIANIILLLIAGHETTVNLIGNTMYQFLTHPDQYDRIKENPELLDNAIEESLRYDTPITLIVRVASKDMELVGKKIEEGEQVTLMLYTANLDDRKFDNALEFDITRENARRHISFGMGIHFCLGAPLARAEAKIAFSEILKRFPDMELEDKQTGRATSFGFNGFEELWVKINSSS